ncbi:MAG: alcohol dehydrogenase catalytic domain-containing protein [Bryobacteraceae bacterium]|jgi:alcohol dehydrogenase
MILVHLEGGRVEMRNEARPGRPAGFALIRLIAGGICNTDLELQRGYYGFSGTPGHEFAGEVVEADTPSLVGKRVVGEINLACRDCSWCRRGMGRHCPRRTVLGIVGHPGAFSEFFTLPERNLHVLPDSLPAEIAVFAEPVAAACEILEQVKIPCASPVAVLGDGKLGLLVAQVLQANGYRVHQFGRHQEKLRIAEKAGVTVEIAGAKVPEAEYEWVVDASGSAAGLGAATRMVRPRGTVILKSTVHGAVPIDTAPLIVNEITLVGSRCGRFEPALELLERGVVDVTSMIAETMPLSEAPRAFEKAAQPGVLKILLRNQSSTKVQRDSVR